MQVSRVKLSPDAAYMFAKLQMVYRKSAQRTFDEVLTAAWYLITQNAVPPLLTIPDEEPTTVVTVFNFDLVSEGHVQMFVELKRRLSLGGRGKATNIDTVEHVVRTVYARYSQD